jgi:hypothetical protein
LSIFKNRKKNIKIPELIQWKHRRRRRNNKFVNFQIRRKIGTCGFFNRRKIKHKILLIINKIAKRSIAKKKIEKSTGSHGLGEFEKFGEVGACKGSEEGRVGFEVAGKFLDVGDGEEGQFYA